MLGGDERRKAARGRTLLVLAAMGTLSLCVLGAPAAIAGTSDPTPLASDTSSPSDPPPTGAPDTTAADPAASPPSADPGTTDAPSAAPTPAPTDTPSASPTATPDPMPTADPTTDPTADPTPTPIPTAAPAALAVSLPQGVVLTLPGDDGFRDATTATVTAPTTAPVSVTAVGAGGVVVPIADTTTLTAGPDGATGAVGIPVSLLAPGTWSIQVAQGASTATAANPLLVGSGAIRSIAVTTDHPRYFPKTPEPGSRVVVTVRAADETGTALPLSGTATVEDGQIRRSSSLPRSVPASASLSVAGMTGRAAAVVVSASGPAGDARTVSRTVALSPSTITRAVLAGSWPTVQPVIDDQLDSVTFTARGFSNSGHRLPVAGTVRVVRNGTVVRTWPVTTSMPTAVTWDGRVHGRIVAGSYDVTLTERGPDGDAATARTTVTVSTAHLPYRIRPIARLRSGNQQGLAIGRIDGATRLFTGVDIGGGAARIDEYDLSGHLLRSSGPLPLGHAAELSISGGRIVVANGSPSALTRVFVVDPASWTVVATMDGSSLGPNGMVAAAPSGGFDVFAGTSGHYAITPMSAAGVLGRSVHVPDEGVPQGLEVVHGEWWLFSSLIAGNRITRLDPATGRVLDTIELAMPGEGEGEAVDPSTGLVYVGCHSPNRFGVLERVVVR